MLTDDEKALFKDSLAFEDTLQYAMDNARDIITLGFDVKKTFIYSDLKYLSNHFLMNAWEFSKLVTFNQVRGAFGFNERYLPIQSVSLDPQMKLITEKHQCRKDLLPICPVRSCVCNFVSGDLVR